MMNDYPNGDSVQVVPVSKADEVCYTACDYTHLPDACTNDVRETKLLTRQQKGDGRSKIRRWLERDRNLLLACLVLVIALNTREGRYLLYPFRILSTWVHEMCHGLAAILTGGRVTKLLIFEDGSGLAYTSVSGANRRAIVSSAGYLGTAVAGCLLLLFRRTTLGPTIGTIGLGVGLLLSCALFVRNVFGAVMLSIEGIALVWMGWKLPAVWLDNLFNFLAATCSLNAVDSIDDLFASGSYYVGGEQVDGSDAHSVADIWGMNYIFWATSWLWISIILTAIGIVCAFDARQVPSCLNGKTVDSTSAVAPVSVSTIGGSSAPHSFSTYAGSGAALVDENATNTALGNDNNYNPSFVGHSRMSAPASTANADSTGGKRGWRWSPRRLLPARRGAGGGGRNGNNKNQNPNEQQLPVAYAVPM